MSTSSSVSAGVSVLVLLYDADGRFLLQHRTSDARVMPDCWGFFGGSMKEGETVRQTLYRETYEEIRHRLRAPQFLLEQDCVVEGRPHHMTVFVEEFLGDKAALELHEGQGWGWYEYDEIAPLNMAAHDCFVVKSASEFIRRPGGEAK